ncbi:MAG: hypothetical protein RhofKO_21980 [Rhodothermales bacterium]
MEPSKRSGGRGRGRHRGKPNTPSAQPQADAAPQKPKRPTVVHLKGNRSLERLQERVELTLLEVNRLREENSALAERLHDLEANPLAHLDATYVAFEEHPEMLKRKVDQFIAAIDTYLGKDEATTENADDDLDKEET